MLLGGVGSAPPHHWSTARRCRHPGRQRIRAAGDYASRARRHLVVWVAQDDDNLGYDVEDRSTSPRRRIEVKGSGGLEPRFFMSDNESRKAQHNPSSYEVQFWGGIDLNRPAAEEYPTHRASGYPIVLRDPPALTAAGLLDAQSDRWRVSSTVRTT